MASNISTALRKVGGLTVSRLRQGMTESNSDASGKLGASIGFNVKSTSKGIDLNIEMLDYWQYVDEGRKKGKQPPVSEILKWLTYPNVRDKIRGGESDAPVENPESLAFLIARKIGREGTKGTDFATNVFESKLIQKELPAIVADAVFEDANSLIDELISGFE
jgi:hypothetical protein